MTQSANRTRRRRSTAAMPEPQSAIDGLSWASDAAAEPTDWYWPGAIPSGSLVLLEGRKSTGKSTVAASIAACVTGGPVVPGWSGPRNGRVVWAGSEESWESVIVPRLKAAQADLSRVGRVSLLDSKLMPRKMVLPDDLFLLADILRNGSVRVLILDPYISLAHPGLDMRVEQQARLYLESLADTLAQNDCVGLLIRHIRKGTSGDTREAGLGSVAISNVARSLLRCDEHPHQSGDNVLSVIACNYGRKMSTQIYRFRSDGEPFPRVEWCGVADIDSDAIAEGRGSEAERDEWAEADRLLAHCIGSGWVSVGDVMREAESAGLSPRMLRRAKARLRVPSRRVHHVNQGWWEWGCPAGGWPANILAQGLHDAEGGARVEGERLGHVAPEDHANSSSARPRRSRRSPRTRAPLGAPGKEAVSGEA